MTPLVSNSRMAKENTNKSLLLPMLRFVGMISLFFVLGYVLWQVWPTLITTGMQWQKQINNELSELLHAAKNESLMAGLSLIGLSFMYGVLHSVGPGHGKLIVTTYIATQDAKVKLSLIITLLSSLVQAFVAVGLVSVLLMLFDASMREVNQQAELLIPLSFYTVILLGIVIIFRNLVLMYRVIKKHKDTENQGVSNGSDMVIKRLTLVTQPVSAAKYAAPASSLLVDDHEHHDNCGCGHQHVVAPELINDASSFKEYLAIILSIGIRPCTGAIMVLLFANMLDIYWLGIVSAVVMALGTALTTSTIAIMTITGKQAVRRYLATGKRNKGPKNGLNITQFIVPIIGGLLLILLGTLLLESRPVGMSPLF
ncbi:nickel/cobalt transporter [Moritella sp.]|uniref:nickel/cobalt transporter n=1 Tax=Moritella sp. TaxID=78556 RepID=UPI001D5A429E|nr:nickel/cobalt transporter [Moritella sp.]MCJ8348604.1 nickel/cobalt transporter [Moritella sp.]NQZ42558.1 nickel/cobalt transporter [Moritella sp.]